VPRLEFRRVDIPARIASLVVATALVAPAAASAQTGTTTLPPSLTQTPTGTANGNGSTKKTPSQSHAGSNQLPNTGLDGRLFGLLGLSLLVSGIGLRMRTADERF
jgi:LPXTG-motif cell wall-anchored protein